MEVRPLLLYTYSRFKYIRVKRIIYILSKQNRLYEIADFAFQFPQQRSVFEIVITQMLHYNGDVNVALLGIVAFAV